VQGTVEVPVAGTVEAVPCVLAAAGFRGAAPAIVAKAASLRTRPGWDQLMSPHCQFSGVAVIQESERSNPVMT
jgi:hypothetical protein